MGTLKIKITGKIDDKISANWETKIVDGSMHPIFSGSTDGWSIDKFIITSIGNGIYLMNNPNPNLAVGDIMTLSQLNNGEIEMMYDHSYASSELRLTAIGQNAKYDVILLFQSTV